MEYRGQRRTMDGDDLELSLPAGFRFHPTDEELVMHYLCRKCATQPISAPIIAEIDLYKFDPWELPGKYLCSFLLGCLICFCPNYSIPSSLHFLNIILPKFELIDTSTFYLINWIQIFF